MRRRPGDPPKESSMKAAVLSVLTITALVTCGAWAGATSDTPSVHLPWQEAGLTERQAAAHLLNRFAFGPRPGEVDAVVRMGLDRWFERQLAAGLPDGRVEADLRTFPALRLSTREIAQTYPPPGLVLLQAREAGILPDDVGRKDLKDENKEALREKVRAFAVKQGYRPQKELLGQLMAQKLLRAVESENQLAEVMTDFWFNHFNVSATDNKARAFLLPYERDTLRPNALGSFRGLLERRPNPTACCSNPTTPSPPPRPSRRPRCREKSAASRASVPGWRTAAAASAAGAVSEPAAGWIRSRAALRRWGPPATEIG